MGVLKDGDDLMDSVAPGLTVSIKYRPLVVVNMVSNKGHLEGVFKTFLWCPSVTVTSGKFTIQDYLGQTMVPHLQQHDFYAGDFCLFNDLNIGDVVTGCIQ